MVVGVHGMPGVDALCLVKMLGPGGVVDHVTTQPRVAGDCDVGRILTEIALVKLS